MKIQAFFDRGTYTLTYVVHQKDASEAIIIDPVWDLDEASGTLSEHSSRKILEYLQTNSLVPRVILETHVHADHLSGSQVLKRHYPDAQVAISQRITEVQKTFARIFNVEDQVVGDGKPFDYLLDDFERLTIAGLEIVVLPTPGHTPACSSYLIQDAVFTGDCLFMPDYGTGRCDFPGGSAEKLYHSIKEHLYTLPEETRVFVGHDYQPGGRELRFESTVGAEKAGNIHLNDTHSKEDFIRFRENRDATLSAPKLLLPSLQVNMRAGNLPEPESNGQRYLKLPLKIEGPA